MPQVKSALAVRLPVQVMDGGRCLRVPYTNDPFMHPLIHHIIDGSRLLNMYVDTGKPTFCMSATVGRCILEA